MTSRHCICESALFKHFLKDGLLNILQYRVHTSLCSAQASCWHIIVQYLAVLQPEHTLILALGTLQCQHTPLSTILEESWGGRLCSIMRCICFCSSVVVRWNPGIELSACTSCLGIASMADGSLEVFIWRYLMYAGMDWECLVSLWIARRKILRSSRLSFPAMCFRMHSFRKLILLSRRPSKILAVRLL